MALPLEEIFTNFSGYESQQLATNLRNLRRGWCAVQRSFCADIHREEAPQQLRDTVEALTDSIEHFIPDETVFANFAEAHHEELGRSREEGNGFYAWGALPSPGNRRTWEAMERDDRVLCVYDNAYRYAARVLAKYDNTRQLVEASGGAEEWERPSDEFVSRYGSLRPVRVADGTHGGPPARRGGARHAGIKAGGWWRRVRPSYCGEVDYAAVLREAHGELLIRDQDLQKFWDEDKITVRCYPGEA